MGEISPPPRSACTSSPSGDGRAREVEVETSRARPGVPLTRLAEFRSKGFVKGRHGLVRRRGSRITLPSFTPSEVARDNPDRSCKPAAAGPLHRWDLRTRYS